MPTATVHARAAIAGNPSDGYGGAVCALTLPFMAAKVTVARGGGGSAQVPIVEAAVRRFTADVVDVGPVSLTLDSSIPRSVGLAGSSAIVIAVLRALNHLAASRLTAMQIATLAHTIERVDLEIPGGWQDQLVQSHGVSALVECGEPPQVLPLASPAQPIPMYLAWSVNAAESSGKAHRGLQERAGSVSDSMVELAELGRSAARAFSERNIHELKAAMNATFDIRCSIMDIAPAQQRMAQTARSFGAAANFAGSGGAIVGVLPKNGPEFTKHIRDSGYDIETWEAT